MQRPTNLIPFIGLWLLCLIGGCGSSTTATISGEVAVDGKPLAKGVISYIPADGIGAPITAPVENGHYQLHTVPGKMLVQISAPIVTGRQKAHVGEGAPIVDITEESLPERYNANSELKFDAQPGSNSKNWSVESKRGKS